MKKIFLMLALLVLPTLPLTSWAVQESVQFSPSFSYYQSSQKGPSTDNGESGTLIDLKLGYLMASGVYLGAAYTTNSYSFKSGSTTTTGALSGYGPSIGYFFEGLYLMFSYAISAEYTVGSTSYRSGTGTIFDLGYRFNMGGSMSVGPSLSFKSFTFKKQGDVELSESYVKNETYPYINLWISF